MFDADRATARSRARRAGFALAAAALLAGCSSMDPTGLLESETAEPKQVDADQAESDGDFPKVGDVPEEPQRRPSSRAERKAMQDTLAADSANARYSDETLRAPEAAPQQPEAAAQQAETTQGQAASARERTAGQDRTQQARSQPSPSAETESRAQDGGDTAAGAGRTAPRDGAETASRGAGGSMDAPETAGDTSAGQTGTADTTAGDMPEVPPAPSEMAAANGGDTGATDGTRRETQRERSQPEPTQPEPTQAARTQPEPTQSERTRAERTQPERSRSEPAQPERLQGETRAAEQSARAEPDRSTKPEQSGASQTTSQSAASRNAGTDGPATRTQQTARAPANGSAAGDSAAVQVNRAQIPQMQPSRQGEPVQLPTKIRQRVGSANATTGSGGSASGRQQSARLQTPPANPSQVEPGVDADGGGQQLAVIYFGHASAGLNSEDRQVLKKVADLYERQGGSLRVVGHASSRTATMDMIQHRMVNLDVSMKRAETVADALVDYGVPRGEVTVEARADRDPRYHEFMPTGEAGNRRAEIFLTN